MKTFTHPRGTIKDSIGKDDEFKRLIVGRIFVNRSGDRTYGSKTFEVVRLESNGSMLRMRYAFNGREIVISVPKFIEDVKGGIRVEIE